MASQAERQLILLSAGVRARRVQMRERAERVAEHVDWGRLTEALRARRLLPTLGPRIVELVGERAGAGFADSVEEAIEAGRRQAVLLGLLGARIVDALAQAGIRSSTLKGVALAEALYGDPGRRLSSDIDLLVAPEQLHAAVEVVRGFGYRAPTEHVDEEGLPLLHLALAHERGELPHVELHWRIHWYERRFASERLLVPAGYDAGRSGPWRPAPAEELVALLLFYARDGFVGLRIATDLAAWWDDRGASLPRGSVDELVGLYPELARAVPAALAVAETVVGLPVERVVGLPVERAVGLPAERIAGRPPRLSLRQRAAAGLANPNPDASSAQVFAEMGLIDGLLMPRGGGREFVRRQLLPPRETLDQNERLASKPRIRSSLGYRSRAVIRFGVLGRYALAMTRLVRRRETPG